MKCPFSLFFHFQISDRHSGENHWKYPWNDERFHKCNFSFLVSNDESHFTIFYFSTLYNIFYKANIFHWMNQRCVSPSPLKFTNNWRSLWKGNALKWVKMNKFLSSTLNEPKMKKQLTRWVGKNYQKSQKFSDLQLNFIEQHALLYSSWNTQ